MSLESTSSEALTTTSRTKPRIERKLRNACDHMVQSGLPWQDAARAANLHTTAMWLALQRPHVIAYIKQQRQVFRESVSSWADFRMLELAKQDDNKAAAFSATKDLRGITDQSVSISQRQSSPGLVVIIQSSHELPNSKPSITIDAQAVDKPKQSDT
jgi:hypothetical protein